MSWLRRFVVLACLAGKSIFFDATITMAFPNMMLNQMNNHPASCGGVLHNGYCFYTATAQQSCDTYCGAGGRNGAVFAGGNWAAQNNTNCEAVHNALGNPSFAHATLDFGAGQSIGCFLYNTNERFRQVPTAYTDAYTPNSSIYRRICSCNS